MALRSWSVTRPDINCLPPEERCLEQSVHTIEDDRALGRKIESHMQGELRIRGHR